MRKSKAEAARTRERIVETAAAEFRKNGIEGTGLATLMAAAGLTQGGFYRHFQSKNELVIEALASTVASEMKWIAGPSDREGSDLQTLATSYLSADHKEDLAGGCPFAALGSELVRLDRDARSAANVGLMAIVDLIAPKFGKASSKATRLEALVAFSSMVGAMTVARLVTDKKLSAQLLRTAAGHITNGSKPNRIRISVKNDRKMHKSRRSIQQSV